MKVQVPTIIEKDLKYIVAYIPFHKINEENFFDESKSFLDALHSTYVVFDKEWTKSEAFVKRNRGKQVSRLMIDVDSGQVLNWPKNSEGEIFIKVVDEGLYQYLDNENNILREDAHEYVPSELQLSDEGWGDYICFVINENGYVENWENALCFIEDKFTT